MTDIPTTEPAVGRGISVTIERSVQTAVRPSERVLQTAVMFGLGVDEQRTLQIIPPTIVPLPAGGVVFITGPSGGGKTTVLRAIAEQCAAQHTDTIAFDAQDELPDVPLVDAFKLPLEQTTALLALAGLGDAFVMLRRPGELSDGQRYRLRLAQSFHAAQQIGKPCVILADEYGATLDRLTATIVSEHIRRWISSTPHTLVCATTHDDLLEPLHPHVLIVKGLGDAIEVHAR